MDYMLRNRDGAYKQPGSDDDEFQEKSDGGTPEQLKNETEIVAVKENPEPAPEEESKAINTESLTASGKKKISYQKAMELQR